MSKTFVLLHGAWHGGWCWRFVADILRARGHLVTTPTQTGLGERRHLISDRITLQTFIDDLVNHMLAEDLSDAIVVGHSFGGNALSGAAEAIPERIRELVAAGRDPRFLMPDAVRDQIINTGLYKET